MELKELKRVIPSKWRVQSFSKSKPCAVCVSYIDARSVMDLLDEVCGPENWQNDYKLIDGGMFAGIGILFHLHQHIECPCYIRTDQLPI